MGGDAELLIPTAFPPTIADPGVGALGQPGSNPQTQAFLALLADEGAGFASATTSAIPVGADSGERNQGVADPDEIELDDSDAETGDGGDQPTKRPRHCS